MLGALNFPSVHRRDLVLGALNFLRKDLVHHVVRLQISPTYIGKALLSA